MRIAQIFDQQLLTLEELRWRTLPTRQVEITLWVDCEEHLAQRLQAKLFHLQDIVSVELNPVPSGARSGPPSTSSVL